MKKYEILAPVGSKENFKIAIRNGADAVYLGLPKFNARMKADNITLEELPELVRYAHLKQVKVYITLNTLLTNSEIKECMALVKECLQAGVDAFIVQDYGLIYLLKSVFPNIVLHGSTQLGVHNVRGAKVAKDLGLTRVVLSREVTLKDIKDIKDNVDIELEVFIQGAMCVAFSGNCYLSSIKHNASGNRGECKQLCRLPYTLSTSINTTGQKSEKTTQATGYMISPRDNCMLEYLSELVDIGVVSFKIEGRLRNSNYLSTATSVYRRALDNILADKSIDIPHYKNELSKVFSRGEFVSGYFDTNDIINPAQNSHLGECIGSVIACSRFKDLFRIIIKTNHKLNTGDGLKFVGKIVVSMGVGNVEYNGNNIILFGKNNIDIGSKVYLTYSNNESSQIDLSRKTSIAFKLIAKVNEPVELEISVLDSTLVPDNKQKLHKDIILKNIIVGEVCELALNKPITKETIINQLQKVDKDVFELLDIQVDLGGDIFLSLSTINELRRKAIESLTQNIEITQNDMPKLIESNATFERLAIVNEFTQITKLQEYDGLILSPTIYNVDTISKFKAKYNSLKFDSPLIVNLPIIVRKDDLIIIDQIIDAFKGDCIFIANNIYALDYISLGATIWAGSGLNISNDYANSLLVSLGCKETISNIEKWCPTIRGSYKIVGGRATLMTFAHCPYKTLRVSSCGKCVTCNNLSLQSNTGANYTIRRFKIANCYFELVDDKAIGGNYKAEIVDLRN